MTVTRVSNESLAESSLIYRHAIVVRLTHWINVACLTVLLMSGLQIFNAHPSLNFGRQSNFQDPGLAIGTQTNGNIQKGVTIIAGHSFNTTGFLGLSKDASGEPVERAFPRWITLPSNQDLATGRRWHFFFAWIFVINGLIYLNYSIWSRHITRDLLPTESDVRHIGPSIWDHIRLRFPKGEEAKRYNVLQKFAYLGVVLILLPLIALAGWAMSPGLDALFPQLLDLFGGRQSARTIHFIVAMVIVVFVLVHVLMVLLSGVWNNLRSMITGRYRIESELEIHHAE